MSKTGKASRFHRELHSNKLRTLLSRIDEEGFAQLIWATTILQGGDIERAGRTLRFPKEAVGKKLGDPYFVSPWELETLFNERLLAPPLPANAPRALDWQAIGWLYRMRGHLRALENAESGILLKTVDVFREMPRILHRQFEWQRGFLNAPQFYRPAFIYGGAKATAYFSAKNGLELTDAMLAGFALFCAFERAPFYSKRSEFIDVGATPETMDAARRLITCPLTTARAHARATRTRAHGPAYQESVLRKWPIVAYGPSLERPRAPIPDLIVPRLTTGLFYDLADGPSDIRNEAADRFEQYVCDLTEAAYSELRARPGEDRIWKGQTINRPDVLVSQGDRLVAVIECKARKMPFSARVSITPEDDAGMEELAKGVFQLWRYFAHHRQGLIGGPRPDADSAAILMTLDPWMLMSDARQIEVVRRAKDLCAKKDPSIEQSDQRKVLFVPIEDWEFAIAPAGVDGLIQTLKASATDEYKGWILSLLRSRVAPGPDRPFALNHRVSSVLPWWSNIQSEPY